MGEIFEGAVDINDSGFFSVVGEITIDMETNPVVSAKIH